MNGHRAFIFNNVLRNAYATIGGVGSETYASYNCAYANSINTLPGTGNIFSDPQFVLFSLTDPPESLDYHLRSSSPCIDAGNPDPQYNDLDGTRNDMGVYGGTEPLGPTPIPIPPPSYPAVTNLSLFPVIVPGNGTIEIRATGRIGPGQTDGTNGAQNPASKNSIERSSKQGNPTGKKEKKNSD